MTCDRVVTKLVESELDSSVFYGRIKMKVGILYDEKIDWSINAFKREFEDRGISVNLFDINSIKSYDELIQPQNVDFPEIQNLIDKGYTTWMNRIYPSRASRGNINKGLNVISWLNSNNYSAINPLPACAVDYDKFLAYQLMSDYGIPTPKTIKINDKFNLENYLEEFSFPCIIKRNTGGMGIDVTKINDLEKLKKILEEKKDGDYIIQQFVQPIKHHDVRIGVINGQPLISYGRTLVNNNDNIYWMGSCNHGSEIIEYTANEEEKKLAVATSNAIGAVLNEVDIQITSNGPIVIENNPTPCYDHGEERWIKLIVDHILKNENSDES